MNSFDSVQFSKYENKCNYIMVIDTNTHTHATTNTHVILANIKKLHFLLLSLLFLAVCNLKLVVVSSSVGEFFQKEHKTDYQTVIKAKLAFVLQFINNKCMQILSACNGWPHSPADKRGNSTPLHILATVQTKFNNCEQQNKQRAELQNIDNRCN